MSVKKKKYKFFIKLLKFPIDFFFSLISLFISFKSLVFLINNSNFKKKKIFLQPEGGFGHTILTCEVLNTLFEKDEWVLVFGYNPFRHNYLVKDIYKNNLLWLELTNNFNFRKVINFYFRDYIFFLLSLYFKYKKIEYYYYLNYISKIKVYPYSKYNKEDKLLYERASYKIISQTYKPKNISNDFNVRFKNLNFNTKSKRKCAIAYKKSKYNEINSINRSSDELESYKNSFFSIVDIGWDIYIYGDLPKELPTWFDDIKKNIFFYSKGKKNISEFNLCAGVIADCYIGPMSGALSWKYMFPKKPSLIIDAHPFGWAYFNSVIAYKIINKPYKNYKIEDILKKEKIYWYEKEPYNVRFTNFDEKEIIIRNFLLNINNLNNEIISPEALKLPEDHPIRWSHSSLSKSWYNIQESFI